MDQLKVFFRQVAKHRFWIAFGISLLLPTVGYLLGSDALKSATRTREGEITSAKTALQPFSAPGIPNVQYQPIVAEKKEALAKDVDIAWRKLFESQEPLLRWPEVVESKFRTWGRKWPQNVDRGQVQQAINDYTIAYEEFVAKRVYPTFKPFNFEDGKGIVVAPDSKTLLQTAAFSLDAPPELGKVWAEQERLWVLTALLDVVAKVNDSAGAKDWDGAIIKQINAIDVGDPLAQDQVSLAKGETLDPAPTLSPDGEAASTAAAPAAPAAGLPGEAGSAMMNMGASASTKAEGVYYFKAIDADQPFKIVPIKMTVLIDQDRLADFLIGLENSPMSIQVIEPEIAKPTTPVTKPVIGETSPLGGGGMMGQSAMMGMGGMSGMGGMMSADSGTSGRSMSAMMPQGMMRGMMGNNSGMSRMPNISGGMSGMRGMGGMSGMGAEPPVVKKGTDIRTEDRAAARKKQQLKDASKKAESKVKVDQYFNIVEVTVYGQARFYNAPPPLPAEQPSTSAGQPTAPDPAAATATPAAPPVPSTPEAPKPAASPAAPAPTPAPGTAAPAPTTPEPPKKDETPKAEATSPAGTPKAEAPAPKS